MADYLPEAIQSVLDSTLSSLEIIVVDDGSTDNTSEVVEEMSKPFQETKHITVSYLQIQHQGKAKAVNEALHRAGGNYITVLDADDRLPKKSLAKRYKLAEERGADLVLGGFSTFNGDRIYGYRPAPETTSKRILINKLLFSIKSPFHQNSMLMSRDLVESVGYYDERLLRGQDKDYAIRLLKSAKHIEIINETVYLYRRYERGLNNRLKNRLLTVRYKALVIRKHTNGLKKLVALAWGALLEFGKMGYEIFTIYRQ